MTGYLISLHVLWIKAKEERLRVQGILQVRTPQGVAESFVMQLTFLSEKRTKKSLAGTLVMSHAPIFRDTNMPEFNILYNVFILSVA